MRGATLSCPKFACWTPRRFGLCIFPFLNFLAFACWTARRPSAYMAKPRWIWQSRGRDEDRQTVSRRVSRLKIFAFRTAVCRLHACWGARRLIAEDGFGNLEAETRIAEPFLAVFYDSQFLHSGLPSACMLGCPPRRQIAEDGVGYLEAETRIAKQFLAVFRDFQLCMLDCTLLHSVGHEIGLGRAAGAHGHSYVGLG